MASGSKSDSVFSTNPMGGKPGKTPSLKRMSGGPASDDGTILSAYPMDNVHGVDLPNTTGDTMGGGPTNLKHSLTGASAVVRGSGGGGKTENSGI